MSLSLCVCVCVCVSEVILYNLEHSQHLKQDVSWILQECLMSVSECHKGALRMFGLYLKGVFRVSDGVLRKFQWCLGKFQVCFREVSWMFHKGR